MMVRKSAALSEAPPTRKPSMFAFFASAAQPLSGAANGGSAGTYSQRWRR